MLQADDVIDLAAVESIRFGYQAVLTQEVCAVGN